MLKIQRLLAFWGRERMKSRVKNVLSNAPAWSALKGRIASAVRTRKLAHPGSDDSEIFEQVVFAAARNLAARGDHRVLLPIEGEAGLSKNKPLRIGFFGNLANQSYITARALRRLGHDVELVVQENNIDAYAMSRPFWEEKELEGATLEEIGAKADSWEPPAFVRKISYDLEGQLSYAGRFSRVETVAQLYRDAMGRSLARDEALLLAQWMGHWPYIKAMNDYDVVHLSMWPICLGVFSPKPYVVCPLGGDLFISAFEQTVQGLMFRGSFRGASHVMVAETNYPQYLDRLECKSPRTFLPLLVDTETYSDEVDEELRSKWRSNVGGANFILSVCRQSWEWKGSDRAIRAFASFVRAEGSDWRLVLQEWGDDVDRSKALIRDLELEDFVLWQPMCSKPLLRRRQRAADIVVDQFVMEGYGSSVLESMAAGKPIVMAPVSDVASTSFSGGPPPFVGARTEAEILSAFNRLAAANVRRTIGCKSKEWLHREHGVEVLANSYVKLFAQAESHRSAPS